MSCLTVALDTEGLFRVPGSVAEVNELIRAYDEGIIYIHLPTYASKPLHYTIVNVITFITKNIIV